MEKRNRVLNRAENIEQLGGLKVSRKNFHSVQYHLYKLLFIS